MADEQPKQPDRPILNYQGVDGDRPRILRGLLHRINRGEDTFLACSALLFAVLAWVFAIVGMLTSAAAVGALAATLLFVFSALLGIGGMFERHTSKTFPLLALALDGAFICYFWIRIRAG